MSDGAAAQGLWGWGASLFGNASNGSTPQASTAVAGGSASGGEEGVQGLHSGGSGAGGRGSSHGGTLPRDARARVRRDSGAGGSTGSAGNSWRDPLAFGGGGDAYTDSHSDGYADHLNADPDGGDDHRSPYAAADTSEESSVTTERSSVVPSAIVPLAAMQFFSAAMLALWDNIMGPRLFRAWVSSDSVSEDVLAYVARHTLNGEICRSDDMGIEPKFYVLSEIGYVVSATIFSASAGQGRDDSPSIFSLSLVLPIDRLHAYLALHDFCEDATCDLVRRFQSALAKTPHTAVKQFESHLSAFAANANAIALADVPPNIEVSRTVFMPGNDGVFEPSFLRRAITSHMQTRSCTVVIGADARLVDLMISTLALFSSAEERRRSRYSRDGAESYCAGFYLQGIVVPTGNVALAESAVIRSMLPTTVVDLAAMSVQQTNQHNEYTVLRTEHRDALSRATAEGPVASPWAASNSLFRTVRESAAMVRAALSEAFRLQPPPLRAIHIAQFHRLVSRKAVALIRNVDAELVHGRPLIEASTKRVRADLGLLSDPDFRVVLACAERLRPGIFMDVFGDPRSMEDKLMLMMETF